MAFVLALLAGLAGQAAAHGHVSHIIAGGTYYKGYDADSMGHSASPPVLIAWSTSASDNGFVAPSAFSTADIICHKDGAPGKAHATIKAGDAVDMLWNTWPESHKGPVLDYLAPCGGDCEAVDKTSLKFFKIGEAGPVSETGNGGTWGTDKMIANNNTWRITIPSDLAAGNYVLRHEIIALHGAGQPDGAQSYPQCVNLEVTGGGAEKPDGVAATALYKADDPGIKITIYPEPTNYAIPGSKLVQGGQEGTPADLGGGGTSSGSSGGGSSGSGSGSSSGGGSSGSSGSGSGSSGTSSAAASPSPTSAGLTFGTPTPDATSTTAAAASPTSTSSGSGGGSSSGSSSGGSSGGGSSGGGSSGGSSSGSSGGSSSGSSSSGGNSSSGGSGKMSKDQAVQMAQKLVDYIQNQGGVHARDLLRGLRV